MRLCKESRDYYSHDSPTGTSNKLINNQTMLHGCVCVLGGVSSDRQCYDEFNTKGSMSGHCGMVVDETGTPTYLKCDQK